jgi:hypothetical protein
MEGFGEEGGICISGKVYRWIKGLLIIKPLNGQMASQDF